MQKYTLVIDTLAQHPSYGVRKNVFDFYSKSSISDCAKARKKLK